MREIRTSGLTRERGVSPSLLYRPSWFKLFNGLFAERQVPNPDVIPSAARNLELGIWRELALLGMTGGGAPRDDWEGALLGMTGRGRSSG